ncbi:hypothetical protein TOK_1752 [Pseudonocardia sp. N23]|nr:hypothetical protein TOK_1752 [Pseudonocardia sp. N23]
MLQKESTTFAGSVVLLTRLCRVCRAERLDVVHRSGVRVQIV